VPLTKKATAGHYPEDIETDLDESYTDVIEYEDEDEDYDSDYIDSSKYMTSVSKKNKHKKSTKITNYPVKPRGEKSFIRKNLCVFEDF
jgi:hypothetical protein